MEIGCGIGSETINFARPGARATSVDLSEKSLEMARQREAVYWVQEQVQFYRGNAEELAAWCQWSVRLVYSFGVIHHTPRRSGLEEVRRYTRAGTTVKIRRDRHSGAYV